MRVMILECGALHLVTIHGTLSSLYWSYNAKASRPANPATPWSARSARGVLANSSRTVKRMKEVRIQFKAPTLATARCKKCPHSGGDAV